MGGLLALMPPSASDERELRGPGRVHSLSPRLRLYFRSGRTQLAFGRMNDARRSYERHIAPFARPFAESTVRHGLGAHTSPMVTLDHGAGTGLVTSLLLRRVPNSQVVALDPSADLLSALANERRCQQIVGTAAELRVGGPRFDLVTSNLVLPFCADAAGDLARIRACSASAATLVVTSLGTVEDVTPFHRFWSAARAIVPDAWEPNRYPHHRFGCVDALVAVVEQGGWTLRSQHRVRAVRRISGINAWSWLSSVLPVGVGDAYRGLLVDERDAVRREFLRQWSAEFRWISGGWTVVATA